MSPSYCICCRKVFQFLVDLLYLFLLIINEDVLCEQVIPDGCMLFNGSIVHSSLVVTYLHLIHTINVSYIDTEKYHESVMRECRRHECNTV